MTTPARVAELDTELNAETRKLFTGLRDIRTARELSIDDVAEALGIEAAWVQRFEAGELDPSMAEIRRYAKTVGAHLAFSVWSWHAGPDAPADYTDGDVPPGYEDGAAVIMFVRWLDRTRAARDDQDEFLLSAADLADPDGVRAKLDQAAGYLLHSLTKHTGEPWITSFDDLDRLRVASDRLEVELYDYARGAVFDLSPEFADQLIGQLQAWKRRRMLALNAAVSAGEQDA